MDFEAVIKSRTATRKFKSVEVEDAKIEKILSAGRLAPTAKICSHKKYMLSNLIRL